MVIFFTYEKKSLGISLGKIVIFGTRGMNFLPSTSALAQVEEQNFQLQVANIIFSHLWVALGLFFPSSTFGFYYSFFEDLRNYIYGIAISTHQQIEVETTYSDFDPTAN